MNSKISSLFAGTQDKCVSCSKKVYPLEKVLAFLTREVEKMKHLFTFGFIYSAGSSWWELISQGLLQVQPWWLRDKPFKLHCTRAPPLLQAPPYAALQAERQLQQARQIRTTYEDKRNGCLNNTFKPCIQEMLLYIPMSTIKLIYLSFGFINLSEFNTSYLAGLLFVRVGFLCVSLNPLPSTVMQVIRLLEICSFEIKYEIKTRYDAICIA